MGMFVVDVHHEKGAELIEVRHQYKPLVNIPMRLVNFDREGTAHDWSLNVGSKEVIGTLFGLLKALAETGEWIIPESRQTVGVTRELVVSYYTNQATSSYMRTIEQCYIDSIESGQKELANHLAGLLIEESKAYVIFSGPNGLRASFTKREVLEMGYNYADNRKISGSMQTLKHAFVDAASYLVQELYENLPDWFCFTDDEETHADEAAFAQATQRFVKDPRGFWKEHYIESLSIEKVVGMGPEQESEEERHEEGYTEGNTDVAGEGDDPLMGLSSPGMVLVVVSGGLVMDVYSELPLDVVLIDRDAEGVPEEDLTPASEVGELLGKAILKSSKIARHIVSEPLKLSNKISGATI